MVAIETKYIGPPNYKGSRYKAYTCNGQSVTISANHALSYYENHVAVAKHLAKKLGWKGTWQGGGNKAGYAFVQILEYDQFTID